jgi:hypothetical protein
MIRPNESDETTDAVAPCLPEVALAKGVLLQVKQDLRRFAPAEDGVGRERYADARSWVTADDFAWPYSFQNVCRTLRLSPEILRAELLPDGQAGWFSHPRRIKETISLSLRGSLANVFGRHRSSLSGRRSSRAVLAH